jgi:hypothetical protein
VAEVRSILLNRWRELASLPEAKGKEGTAIALADHTDCSIEEARRVLRSAPHRRPGLGVIHCRHCPQ